MSIKFNVDDRQLRRELKRLGRKLGGEDVARALIAGSLLISNEAKRMSPIEDGVLRSSIHVGGHNGQSFSGEDPWDTYSDIGGPHFNGNRVSVDTGTNLIYAQTQEFGALIETNPGMINKLRILGYRISDGTPTVYVPATPFLRPAFRKKWKPALNKVRKILRTIIRRQW
jgi:hypothetical protein